ncbi:MAG TPA: hypothetical protein VGQ20_13095 [Acidimicrobiales bacterium]|jgi:hypothetical protein|nr:hypothetical protein [Acidimicrobiales bacterium]
MHDSPGVRARQLRRLIEPVAQASHAAYGGRHGCDELTQMEWYLGGRLACLGPVPGEVAVALFAVLEPSIVVPGVRSTWAKVEPDVLSHCRVEATARLLESRAPRDFDAAATATLLQRAIAALEPAGHTLFAAWQRLGPTGSATGDVWRAAVMLREHRGAAHIAAWRAEGLAPVEVLVLTEAFSGAPIGSHSHALMGWPDVAVQAAVENLTATRLLNRNGITRAGTALREAIEVATDRQEIPAVRALGDGFEALETRLVPLASALAGPGPTAT